MKFREGTIPKTVGQLTDRIAATILRAPKRHFPDSYGHDFDGAFYSIQRGAENLRKRFGDAKTDQVLEMLAQAKAHYEASENNLGGPLLQDTEMVILNRQPWAYPKDLYRWPLDASLPEVSKEDLVNRGDETD